MGIVSYSREEFDKQVKGHGHVGVSFHKNNFEKGFHYLILGQTYYDFTSVMKSEELRQILINPEEEGGYLEDRENDPWKKDYSHTIYSNFDRERDTPDKLFALALVLKRDIKVYKSDSGSPQNYNGNNCIPTSVTVQYVKKEGLGDIQKIEIKKALDNLKININKISRSSGTTLDDIFG